MGKNNLLVIIFETLCGLACIGVGIYYMFCDKATQAVVFLVVGAGCIVMAVRAFFNMRKQKKDREKEDQDDNTKQ